MKITNLISMLAAASAVGFCMSATAGEGQTGTLVLTAPVANVSVTAGGEATGGEWNNDNTPPTVENGYFEIDCDAASSNQFTATSAATGAVVKCEFVLKPSPVPCAGVPSDTTLSKPDGGAQVAFCIATNTAGGASTLMAYVGGDWKALTGTVPTNEVYTLTITLDYSSTTNYAKFAIGGTTLTYNSEEWVATGKDSATGVQDYCFVGSGSLKSILTTGQNIAAEEINITPPGGSTPVKIEIPEEAIAAFGGDGGAAAAATELAAVDLNGKTKLENYVIFGQKALDKNIEAATKPVAKPSTKVVDGYIPLNFQNLDVKNVPGTSVSYQLMGADTAGGTFTAIGSPVSNAADVKIPSDTTKKVFKVQVNVNYTPAN